MEFKIDTKPAYTLIMPVSNLLNANLTGAIRQKAAEIGQSGSSNLIIDLQKCITADDSALPALQQLHEDFYSKEHSLVFTGMNEDMVQKFKTNETELIINIAPTMAEAVDIISMEILERDLFNEE
jgi:anti-anti-sigma regulatory factor